MQKGVKQTQVPKVALRSFRNSHSSQISYSINLLHKNAPPLVAAAIPPDRVPFMTNCFIVHTATEVGQDEDTRVERGGACFARGRRPLLNLQSHISGSCFTMYPRPHARKPTILKINQLIEEGTSSYIAASERYQMRVRHRD